MIEVNSMLIKSIQLTNFRQYKGIQKFEFSTDPEQNVTVIIGQNTCGKTTLVRAFKWCLYGDAGFRDSNLLNAEEQSILMNGTIGAQAKVSVTIELTKDSTDYIITRTEVYEKKSETRIYEVLSQFKIYYRGDHGALKSIQPSEQESEIYNILPEELSDYFFFWGERIENLTSNRNISSAVNNFLGLNIIDNCQKHLKTCIVKFRNKAAEVDKNNDLKRLTEDINKINEDITNVEKKLEKKNELVNWYKVETNNAYNDLFKSKNVSENQKQLDRLKELINKEEQDLEESNNQFEKNFNWRPQDYFAQPVVEEAISILERNPEESIGWTNISVKTIDEIIGKGECICGAKVEYGSNVYNHLIEQKAIVAPNVIGSLSSKLISDSRNKRNYYHKYKEDLHNSFENIREHEENKSDYQREAEEIQINESDIKELDRKKHKYERYSKNYKDLLVEYGDLKGQLSSLKSHQRNLEMKYSSQVKRIETLNKNQKYLLYAQEVLDSIKKDYADKKSEIREKLREYATRYFDEMYSGDRKININDQYKIEVENEVDGKWIKSETSPGLETVKNFAFICALVQIAKERIALSNGHDGEMKDIISSEPYPLVLDAPFSQADEKHVPAISKAISETAEQIILVVMEKDWNFAKEALDNKVGAKYILEKQTETYTKVKEQRGKEYVAI